VLEPCTLWVGGGGGGVVVWGREVRLDTCAGAVVAGWVERRVYREVVWHLDVLLLVVMMMMMMGVVVHRGKGSRGGVEERVGV
jgi:cbb3-type cytochrome oxidase subunit 1